jgi:hypothetical protein
MLSIQVHWKSEIWKCQKKKEKKPKENRVSVMVFNAACLID